MPDMNGIEASRLIQENYPRVRVVVLSFESDPVIIGALFESGVSGFVWKAAAPSELIPAIESILTGWPRLSAQRKTAD